MQHRVHGLKLNGGLLHSEPSRPVMKHLIRCQALEQMAEKYIGLEASFQDLYPLLDLKTLANETVWGDKPFI